MGERWGERKTRVFKKGRWLRSFLAFMGRVEVHSNLEEIRGLTRCSFLSSERLEVLPPNIMFFFFCWGGGGMEVEVCTRLLLGFNTPGCTRPPQRAKYTQLLKNPFQRQPRVAKIIMKSSKFSRSYLRIQFKKKKTTTTLDK